MIKKMLQQFINLLVAVKGGGERERERELVYGSLYFRGGVYSVPFHLPNLPHVPAFLKTVELRLPCLVFVPGSVLIRIFLRK